MIVDPHAGIGTTLTCRMPAPGRWRCLAGPAKLAVMRTVPSLLW